jgi:PKD repeat protein
MDDDGGSDTESFQVTVKNVSPVLVVSQDQMVNEGQLLNLSGSGGAPPLGLFVDAGVNDTHTATVDWGDGSGPQSASVLFFNGAGALGGTHTYADNGIYSVTVTVSDDNGGSDTESFQVTVKNVSPVLVVSQDQMLNEGQLLNLSGSGGAPPLALFVDQGILDTHTATVDWGDGSGPQSATVISASGSGVLGGSHTYLENGIYTVTVIVMDDDGGSATDTFQVVVKNVAPIVALNPVAMINENGIATLTGSYTDIGLLDGHTLTVGWNDANDSRPSTFNIPAIRDAAGTPTLTVGQTFSSSTDGAVLTISAINAATGEVSFSVQHQYLDDGVAPGNATFQDTSTITVKVDDDDGDSGTNSETVLVKNVAPVLVVVSDQSINEGQVLDLSGSVGPPLALFVDSGTLDVHIATINWGDGSPLENAAVTFLDGAGSLGGSHTYADNGVYTVIVTIQDDDSGMDTDTFLVMVNNVVPTTANVVNLAVDEGSAFTLVGLNVLLSDPGFDNPANPLPGGELQETFAIHSINWGDGSPTDTSSVAIVNRISGNPGVPTTAQFDHDPHIYADDGVYTVTIRVADDDMGAFTDPSKFITGVAGVDFVDLTFTIRVDNVAPTLTSVTPSVTTINESESTSFTALFSDPGFDNPLNPNPAMPPAIVDPLHESFTYDIDWGDGRLEEIAVAVADLNGSAGVPSTGTFGGTHVYADDGTYTVTVRIHDDNGGAHIRTFDVVVLNVNPSFVPPSGGGSFEGDDVTSEGITTIRVAFEDPGFDNTANINPAEPPTVTDTLHESFTHIISWGDGTVDAIHTYADSGTYNVTVTVTGPGGVQMFSFPGFDSTLQPVLTLVTSQAINDPMAVTEAFTYVVDWGDGNVQTIQLMLKQPGNPLFSNGLTTVVAAARTSGNETTLTTGSFEVQHQYLGPPNPANPTADIRIDVTIVDDNNGSVTDFVEVANPGIDVINVAIDTTPEVPRLDVVTVPVTETFLDSQSSSNQGLQQASARVVTSELLVSSERYLELEVVAPDGTVISRHRIRDEALNDLRAFFATLPDNHYRIYLVRTDNNSRRLIMDVYVRRGRVIDPSDDSEGTRDRPPTSEELPQNTPPPLEQNPQLESLPEDPGNAAPAGEGSNAEARLDAGGPINDDIAGNGLADPNCQSLDTAAAAPSPQLLVPLRGSHRWVVPLAAFSLAASRGGWSQRVAAALENADERDWQRLRRAGRLGGRRNPR